MWNYQDNGKVYLSCHWVLQSGPPQRMYPFTRPPGMYVITPSPTQNAQGFFFLILKKDLFLQQIQTYEQKPFAQLFREAPSVSLNVSLLSSPVQVCAPTQWLALAPLEIDFLKGFNSFFFILQWVFIFGDFHLQKKEKVFTESYIPQCRGSLNLSRSNCCCQYARTYFFINFSKALIILRGPILGPIMPSNSRYLQSFFV